MKKMFALVSLSLGITLVNPVFSASAQVRLPRRLPRPLPVPSQPQEWSPQIPSKLETPPPALKPMDMDFECRPRHACLGWDSQLFWGRFGKTADRWSMVRSINHSLRYLKTPTAARVYADYPIEGITLERVRRSLLRFRQLLLKSRTPTQLQDAVRREFEFYKSIGNDGQGTVKFTSYYEPIYEASRQRTSVYKYPLYRLPPDFEQWPQPHPKRLELEGKDGLLGDNSPLKGLELFWFRNRLDAYLVHIQGSAKLKLTDGTTTSVGYANGTQYPWTSIGKELLKDGRITRKSASMPGILRHFQLNPEDMDEYLPRWERFVFFRDKGNTPAIGSIGVPVTADRSIATDKSIMPPGALAIINSSFPYPTKEGGLTYRRVSRFVMDQDTGSAIKGPGRVDYFAGRGKIAGDRAGVTGGPGTLYYLLLKE
ncbi:murein transglycosylase A [Mastigocoleus sp. MO_188.B34]|uniref:murein transglycosylase A n=1 Tax=Mastigocoleus sp. MO_188.B34 TaxID=3036635 RepID=UPI00263610CE|nr:murein transglycosylase A [Mastigocoleus sp. MO_188.B34]MDJ0693085.1 murein transglycosylase A [Mastigocoleus sp. MO_188.B34]